MNQFSKLTIFLLVLLLSFGKEGKAGPLSQYVRSPRGLLMGDAYHSLADREYSLWYNPALLGRNGGVQITPLDAFIGVSNILDDSDRFDNLPDTPEGIANQLSGIPIHLNAGYAPGLKVGPFGFSFIANSKTNAIILNNPHPLLDIDYRYDRGFSLGYAFSFGSAPKSRKKGKKVLKTSGVKNSIGFAAKYMHRDALVKRLDLFGSELFDIINQDVDDYRSFRRALGYTSGQGWGFDIGWDTTISTDSTQFAFSASWQDIGDTNFNTEDGVGFIPREVAKVNVGTSFTLDIGFFYWKLALDLAPINQGLDPGRWLHVGTEIGFPFVSVMAGLNEGYLSYGVSVDLWFMEIVAGLYSVEVGESYRQKEGKRAILYLNILDINWSDIDSLWDY